MHVSYTLACVLCFQTMKVLKMDGVSCPRSCSAATERWKQKRINSLCITVNYHVNKTFIYEVLCAGFGMMLVSSININRALIYSRLDSLPLIMLLLSISENCGFALWPQNSSTVSWDILMKCAG